MLQLIFFLIQMLLKMEYFGFILIAVVCYKDADGMANSVDPDQTAP